LRGYRPHEEKPKEKSIVFIQPKEKKDAIAGRKPAKERKDNRNTHLFIRGQQLVGNDKKTLKAQISG